MMSQAVPSPVITVSLQDTPIELLGHILLYLDPRSLLRCRLVCSTFRHLIDASAILQYTIELAIAGQEDGGHYPLPVRREMLRHHQQCWNKLKWTHEMRLQIFHGGLWELYGNVLAQNTVDKFQIHFKQLPSKARNIEEKNWVVDVRDFRVRDFGIDPAQDLLVIVEQPRWRRENDHNYRIHLRTLSTGGHHPAARIRTLLHEQQLRDHASYSIQTRGDILGVLIDSHLNETEVVLWNWKTGDLFLNLVSNEITSMSFLGEKYIILGRTAGLVVVDFVTEPSDPQRLDDARTAFTFSFPPIAKFSEVISVEVRSDPAPIWEPSSDLLVPFFQAPNDRLYVVSLVINHMANFARIVQMFALGSSFLSLIEKAAGQNTARFDWHMWGPDGTRMILPHFPPSDTWVCYVYGTRYVATRHLQRPQVDYAYIYDFNRSTLRNSRDSNMTRAEVDIAVGNGGCDESQLLCANVTAPEVIVDEELFEGEVVTKLEYHLKCWPIPGHADEFRSVMCSEDGIVVMDESAERFSIYTV